MDMQDFTGLINTGNFVIPQLLRRPPGRANERTELREEPIASARRVAWGIERESSCASQSPAHDSNGSSALDGIAGEPPLRQARFKPACLDAFFAQQTHGIVGHKAVRTSAVSDYLVTFG